MGCDGLFRSACCCCRHIRHSQRSFRSALKLRFDRSIRTCRVWWSHPFCQTCQAQAVLQVRSCRHPLVRRTGNCQSVCFLHQSRHDCGEWLWQRLWRLHLVRWLCLLSDRRCLSDARCRLLPSWKRGCPSSAQRTWPRRWSLLRPFEILIDCRFLPEVLWFCPWLPALFWNLPWLRPHLVFDVLFRFLLPTLWRQSRDAWPQGEPRSCRSNRWLCQARSVGEYIESSSRRQLWGRCPAKRRYGAFHTEFWFPGESWTYLLRLEPWPELHWNAVPMLHFSWSYCDTRLASLHRWRWSRRAKGPASKYRPILSNRCRHRQSRHLESGESHRRTRWHCRHPWPLWRVFECFLQSFRDIEYRLQEMKYRCWWFPCSWSHSARRRGRWLVPGLQRRLSCRRRRLRQGRGCSLFCVREFQRFPESPCCVR